MPGIGGLTGFALLVPFTYSMDPISGLAMLLGMHSVTTTSDTIPAVLFGVPGTAASQATVLDGLPMTKRGEAGAGAERGLSGLTPRGTDRSGYPWTVVTCGAPLCVGHRHAGAAKLDYLWDRDGVDAVWESASPRNSGSLFWDSGRHGRD